MDFLPSEDQSLIVDSCRQFLARELPLQRLLAGVDDRRHWPAMGELGWFGLGVEAEYGGVGQGLMEEMLVCIEAGRHLLSPALLASLLGAHVAAQSGRSELAAGIIAGETGLSLALPLGHCELGADAVSGRVFLIEQAGSDATLMVTPQGAALLPGDTVGEVLPGMDESVHLCALELSGQRPELFLADAGLYRRGMLLSAAMAVGLAQQVKELSVTYAGEREQFGRPIGSFQAVKHRCADMAVRDEAALSLLIQACLETAEQLPGAEFDTSAAKLLADQAAGQNAADSVHLHGAMGFTREMPIHLFVKRAQLLSQLFGDRRALLEDLARLPTPD